MINKNDFYKEVAEETGFAMRNVKEVAETMKWLLIKHLKKMDTVKLFDGVIFEPRRVEEETRSIPILGGEVRTIPAHTKVAVKIKEYFRDQVNS